MTYIKKRIGLTGAGGTGKTYLAKAYVEKVDTPFVGSVVRGTAEEFGITSHQQILTMAAAEPERGIAFQTACSEKVYEGFKAAAAKNDHFITDRSPLDYMGYFTIQNSFYANSGQIEKIIKLTKDTLTFFDVVFLLKPGAFKAVDDGYRTTNLYFNDMLTDVFRFCARKADYNMIEMPLDIVDVNDRIDFIQKQLGKL